MSAPASVIGGALFERPTHPTDAAPLALTARIVRVADSKGVLGVPDDPRAVGWWVGSARPGSAVGSVVLDGHVDSVARGLGALFALTKLKSGDPVTVTA